MAREEPTTDVDISVPLPKRARIMDHVADRLSSLIIEGTLAPGMLIRQEALASRLGVSRTPLREALQQLEADGLVTIGPSGAAKVASYALDESHELMEVREVIDGLAARVLAQRGIVDEQTVAVLRGLVGDMEEAARADDKHRFLALNARFHLGIIDATHHRPLQRQQGVVRTTSQAMYLSHGHQPVRHGKAGIEHREILEAIEARDETKAEELARAHIRMAADFWLRQLADDVKETSVESPDDDSPAR